LAISAHALLPQKAEACYTSIKRYYLHFVIMTETPLLNGILHLIKPAGISSFDCIRYLKKILPRKTKIGHGGTLDPFADGLLIVGIGKGTKLLNTFENSSKEYLVKAKVGELTDTLDHTGAIVDQKDPTQFDFGKLEEYCNHFMPSYEQVPPIYSSLKHQGEPLYKLARTEALTTEELQKICLTKKRTSEIKDLKIISVAKPFFTFSVHVSKGTYIRTLVHDIAQQGNNNATVYELTRTKVANISLQTAIHLNEINEIGDISKNLKTTA
jgi:tRNA pseudouridine55 synthase